MLVLLLQVSMTRGGALHAMTSNSRSAKETCLIMEAPVVSFLEDRDEDKARNAAPKLDQRF
jgi:hypothetical protein